MVKYEPPRKDMCVKCRIAPRVKNSIFCRVCLEKQRQKIDCRVEVDRTGMKEPDINKPCARCGGSPRVAGASYCAKCLKEKLGENKQKRQERKLTAFERLVERCESDNIRELARRCAR